MSDKPIDSQRRRLVQLSALAASAPVFFHGSRGFAQEQLDESDAMAQQLSYVHDASQSTNAARKPDTNCANCGLYQGAEGDEWGGCPLFAGKQVNANGWCSAWVAKA